ncbi:MAG TPA: GatB/YqeY domain-containing protein [Patescibacteria group bacterium]|nr:GatB/YqeY domain-containing protein [Patescibacteria group bacterium]
MLTKKITQDLKDAMRAGDNIARDTLRMLQSMVMNESIALKKKDTGLTDEEVAVVLRRAIKQRRESEQQYRNGNRPELAQKEEEESMVLER